MTDEEARRILAGHGEQDIPERGKLRAELRLRAQHYADQDAAPADADGAPAETVTAASEPPSGVAPERAPRKPRPARGTLTGRLRAGRGQPKKKARRRPAHPRVPVDRLAGMMWEGFGRLFTPVSLPVGRTLQLQAPIAGLVLEDVVRDTMVDRALQPIARNLDKGRKVYALAGPPMIVMALEASQQLPPEQRQLREAFLVPMLIESLMAWDDVAGDKLEESLARQADDGPRRERAQRIMQMIFTPSVPPDSGGPPPADDDEAAARAQQMSGAGM